MEADHFNLTLRLQYRVLILLLLFHRSLLLNGFLCLIFIIDIGVIFFWEHHTLVFNEVSFTSRFFIIWSLAPRSHDQLLISIFLILVLLFLDHISTEAEICDRSPPTITTGCSFPSIICLIIIITGITSGLRLPPMRITDAGSHSSCWRRCYYELWLRCFSADRRLITAGWRLNLEEVVLLNELLFLLLKLLHLLLLHPDHLWLRRLSTSYNSVVNFLDETVNP